MTGKSASENTVKTLSGTRIDVSYDDNGCRIVKIRTYGGGGYTSGYDNEEGGVTVTSTYKEKIYKTCPNRDNPPDEGPSINPNVGVGSTQSNPNDGTPKGPDCSDDAPPPPPVNPDGTTTPYNPLPPCEQQPPVLDDGSQLFEIVDSMKNECVGRVIRDIINNTKYQNFISQLLLKMDMDEKIKFTIRENYSRGNTYNPAITLGNNIYLTGDTMSHFSKEAIGHIFLHEVLHSYFYTYISESESTHSGIIAYFDPLVNATKEIFGDISYQDAYAISLYGFISLNPLCIW